MGAQELLIGVHRNAGDIADAQGRELAIRDPAHDRASGDVQVFGNLLRAQKVLVGLKSYLVHERLLGRKVELVQSKKG